MINIIEAWSWNNIPFCQKLTEFDISSNILTCQSDIGAEFNNGYIIIKDAGKIYRRITLEQFSQIKTWYSTNINIFANNIYCLPLGVQKENIPILKKTISSFKKKPKALIYLNYNPVTSNNISFERTHLFRFASSLNYITIRYPIKNDSDAQETYYQELSEHMFCICPEGHGIDSYRIWESIYLGVVPIVKQSPIYNHFSDLPILQIPDWTLLTDLDWLLMNYNRLEWNQNKIHYDYWIQKINNDFS